jgi:hypothetical protein
MTVDKLQKGNLLRKEIDNLDALIDRGLKQTCEWIVFTHGNGSDKSVVCDDEDIIKEVRRLIVDKNFQKQERLNKEFSEL